MAVSNLTFLTPEQLAAPGAPGEIPPLQQALNETRRVLRSVLGSLDGMAYRYRAGAGWPAEFLSEGCRKLTGFGAKDPALRSRTSYEEIIYPHDRRRVQERIAAAVSQQQPFDVEYRIIGADSGVKWVWEKGVGILDESGELAAIEGFIQDITERHASQLALRRAVRRYRGIFENAAEGMYQSSPEGTYLSANPALARIYGYASPRELIRAMRDIGRQVYVDPKRRTEFVQIMDADGAVTNFESQVYRKSGEIIWISENARLVKDEHGRPLYFEGTVEDVTERKFREAQIEHEAGHDALTGLPGRPLLLDRLQRALLGAKRYGRMVAVAVVDLDRFKSVNDSLGHTAGDQALKTVAEYLKACVRESDTVARSGGDEFVLVLSRPLETDGIPQIMQRVLETVSQPCTIEDGQLTLTCSVGVSLYPEDGENAQSLLENADSAMRMAKAAGRNGYRYFASELNAVIKERQEIEAGLRTALAREEFDLYYQPKVNLRSGKITGAEALIRWRSPADGVVPPARFIAIAEESGLIVPIGYWVLRKACAQNRAWQEAGVPPICVSVNLSERQLQEKDLVANIGRILEETGLAPRYLELELPETLVRQDNESFITTLRAIKAIGVKLSIEDFGTGESSLSHLKRFPVDTLKIDRSFVRDIAVDEEDTTVIKAIIGLGQSLNLEVVAEGVETGEQYHFLRGNHCDVMQGSFVSMPVPGDEFRRLFAA